MFQRRVVTGENIYVLLWCGFEQIVKIIRLTLQGIICKFQGELWSFVRGS
jgi:hypothetical protein